jgi:hypothetical protein
VRTIKLTGTGGTKATLTIDGTEFQSIYGLKSAYFSLSVTAP